ncbi:hypothetical protein D917_01261 [Trichinella nativa]|uniref:Transmembrane protein 106 N-terminal domain-containing protein n=1 Tax=Trichinella nativa TaxID=6335 RepID=A0A1Y3ESI7_9BILA|nr:hypothetical protein D917_01261 [Trichinella nativa]
MEMGDKIPIVRNEQPNTSDAIIEADQSFYYEEFMEGSVPCPSCDGAGRIPKEQEKQLVALIPLTDKRLKPRRTTLWVLSAVSASLLTWALCIFFLIPRSIVVSSDDSSIVPYAAYVNESQPTVKLSFLFDVTITSNYLGHSEQTSVSNNQQLYCSNQIPDDIYANIVAFGDNFLKKTKPSVKHRNQPAPTLFDTTGAVSLLT